MSTRPLKVVLSTRGTLGDVAPFVGVAKQLQALGHHPVVATCRSYGPLVRDHGVAFAPVAPHLDEVCRDHGLTPEAFRLRSMNPWSGGRFSRQTMIQPYFDRIYGDLRAVCQGADVLIANPTTAAWARLVALECGVPWKTLILQCMNLVIKSAQEPPVLPGMSMRWVAHALGPRVYERLLRASAKGSRRQFGFVDAKARALGLYDPRFHPLLDGAFSPGGVMAMFPSPFLAERLPTDLGTAVNFLGFCRFDAATQGLSAALEAFLQAGSPPVVFCLGTANLCRAGDVYEHWSRWCEQLGLRAVFIGERQHLGDRLGRLPKGQILQAWVSIPALLARSLGLVSPGGLGLSSQGLMAGVPQVVVPFAYDQPDNAFRLSRMGVAITVKPSQAKGAAMGRALARLAHDSALRERVQRTQMALDPVCGTEYAARLIVREFAREAMVAA